MITKIQELNEIKEAKGVFRAGATDLIARQRLGMPTPSLIDLNNIDSLKKIQTNKDHSSIIGALVKIDQLSKDDHILTHYPGLAKAASGLATPQIRRMATVGGGFLQKTRCAYYRNPSVTCFKK